MNVNIYIANFTQISNDGKKDIEDYRIVAESKKEAKKQIEELFRVDGDIRIIKEENGHYFR